MSRTNEVSLRLSTKGRDELLKTMRDMGGEYEKAARRIEAGSRQSSAAIKGVNAAAKEARGSLEEMAGRGGSVGRILQSLGPAGFAAAAGIGAVVAGLGAALKISREAVSAFDQIGKGADTLQLSTDAFQALKVAAGDEGVEFGKVEAAVRNLDKAHADLVRGKGDLLTRLRETNPQLVEMLRNTTDNEQRLNILTGALRGAKSETERASIAYAAFGQNGLDVALMLERQEGGMRGMIDRARELGLVVREDVIRNAEDMETRFGHASQVIDLQLKQAFIDLAPLVLESAQLMADVATAISKVIDMSRQLSDRTTSGLETRVESLIEGMERLGAQRDEVERALKTGGDLSIDMSAGGRRGFANAEIAKYFQEARQIYAELGRRAEQEFQKGASETRQQATQEELEQRKAALEASLELTKQYAAEAARERNGDAVNQFVSNVAEVQAELDRVEAELARRARMPKPGVEGATDDDAARRRAEAEMNRLRAEAIRLQKDLGDYTLYLAEATARYRQMLDAGLITQEQYDEAVRVLTDDLTGLTAATQRWAALAEATLSPAESVSRKMQALAADYEAGRINAELYAAALAALTAELEEAAETERRALPGFNAAETIKRELEQARFAALGPAEKLRAEMTRINELMDQGLITGEEAADWLELYSKRLEDAAEKTGLLVMGERLLDAAMNGRIRTMEDVGRVFAQMLVDMVRQYLVARQTMQGGSFLDFIFGSSSPIGSFFGGGSPAAAPAVGVGMSHSGGSARHPPARRKLGSGLMSHEKLLVVDETQTILTASGRMNIASQIAAMAAERQMMAGLVGRAVAAGAGASRQGWGMLQPIINNYAGAEVTAEQREGPDGPDLSIDIRGRMTDMARGGVFDTAFRERYGLRAVGA